MGKTFNIIAIGQSGRLQHEALLLAGSLRQCDPGFAGRLFIAEPQPGPLWPDDPRMDPKVRAALESLGFRTAEAARAVAQALRDLGEEQSTPSLIRESLKRASR